MIPSVFDEIVAKLAQAKIPSPRLETRLLIAYVLGKEASDILPHHVELDSLQLAKLDSLVSERVAHKPLCKILGEKSFYKYDFVVNENVLSPRPDTEILVEAAIDYARKTNAHSVLDLGTGSGCILLSILGDVEELNGVGMDISSEALKIAKINTQRLGLEKRCALKLGSWFDEQTDLTDAFDIIVSNPPYIPSADINNLSVEVKEYDPLRALDGGKDGYRDYQRLAIVAKEWLHSQGVIFLEVGIGQAETVQNIFEQRGWTHLETKKDLSGIKRCVILKK